LALSVSVPGGGLCCPLDFAVRVRLELRGRDGYWKSLQDRCGRRRRALRHVHPADERDEPGMAYVSRRIGWRSQQAVDGLGNAAIQSRGGPLREPVRGHAAELPRLSNLP